ncbi:hypothetical protein MKL29_06805 [Streptococcus suis]|nr:hypothetical protein [Streptococcus suis]
MMVKIDAKQKSTRYPFTEHSSEKRALYERRRASQDKADKHFKTLFNQRISWVIVANVMSEYVNQFRQSARTFEEAWQAIGYEKATEIMFKAINDLPASGNESKRDANKVTALSDYQTRKRVNR